MMNKSTFWFCFMVLLASQFEVSEAWLWDMLDRWIFSSFTPPKLRLVDENAEKKFLVDEAARINRPRILEEQLIKFDHDVSIRETYHSESYFIMKIFLGFYLYYLRIQRNRLQMELERAKYEYDMEPFCHHRFHGDRKQITDSICREAFQNSFFKDRGWILPSNDPDNNRTFCPHISVTKISNEDVKIASHREARKCKATTADGKILFSFYLIAGPNYLRNRNRLEYYVLLNKDIRMNDPKKNRYYSIFSKDTNMIQVAAYID